MLSEKGEHCRIGIEVPRRPDTHVVIAVAIPVVDVQPVLVEVADARDVTNVLCGELIKTLFACPYPLSLKIKIYFRSKRIIFFFL